MNHLSIAALRLMNAPHAPHFFSVFGGGNQSSTVRECVPILRTLPGGIKTPPWLLRKAECEVDQRRDQPGFALRIDTGEKLLHAPVRSIPAAGASRKSGRLNTQSLGTPG